MPTLSAEFDGRVFIPCGQVDLPPGTRVEVLLPAVPRRPTAVPRRPTAEEDREWQQILSEISGSPPEFATVEEAMKYSRKRPDEAA
jgi:hypothetical protein